jgi:hypothetical protein
VRVLVAFTMIAMASSAFAGGVAPESDKPDVLYIGEGWSPDLSDGCVDRGECKLPELPRAAGHAGPVAMPGKAGIFGRGSRDCSGAVGGIGDIRGMFDTVSRCITGG